MCAYLHADKVNTTLSGCMVGHDRMYSVRVWKAGVCALYES